MLTTTPCSQTLAMRTRRRVEVCSSAKILKLGNNSFQFHLSCISEIWVLNALIDIYDICGKEVYLEKLITWKQFETFQLKIFQFLDFSKYVKVYRVNDLMI